MFCLHVTKLKLSLSFVTNVYFSVTWSSHIEGGIKAEGVGEYGARENI
jgi:hypothetical protein